MRTYAFHEVGTARCSFEVVPASGRGEPTGLGCAGGFLARRGEPTGLYIGEHEPG
ncbi:hypothetical protein [Streptomyces cirratus]|nr:hypothetical protein [Streptomyces cirratus]